jgi:hypothetical protein
MRCDEVIRELAVPTDDRDSADLAEHLADCRSCAIWAKRDAEFDRLWAASRPLEPSSQAWDSVWSQIASSLDSKTQEEFREFTASPLFLNGSVSSVDRPRGLAATSSRSRNRNWAAIGLIGLAQAAAVLLAVGWAWHISSRSNTPQVTVTSHSPKPPLGPSMAAKESGPLAVPSVEIDAGQWVIIRVEDSAVKVVDLTPDGMSSSVDDGLLALNAAEAIPNPVVAMKE